MLQGVTAFLEAIDERVERHARQQTEGATKTAEVTAANSVVGGKKDEIGRGEWNGMEGTGKTGSNMGDVYAPRAVDSKSLLPTFPSQPGPFLDHTTPSRLYSGTNNSSSVHSGDGGDAGEGTLTAMSGVSKYGLGDELSALKRRDEEIEALTREIRRHQAATDAAKQELLQRSLQVHQLEESLRDTKIRFDEHRAKSRCLLEEKQREYEVLRNQLELQKEGGYVNNHENNGDLGASDLHTVVVEQQEEIEQLQGSIVSMKQERERLQAQVGACRREVLEAHEERLTLLQQIDVLRLDIRGAQEALESEVSAHKRSKELLQNRHRELNELRAAVEKNGGTFTATGALVSLRNDDMGSRDHVLLSRHMLEKQNALEAALRDAAEWRRRCERATHRLEEERTTRVFVSQQQQQQQQSVRDGMESRSFLLRRGNSTDGMVNGVLRCIDAVDGLALRIGRALRRYPVIRMAALLYIVCLHVWIGMSVVVLSSAAAPGSSLSTGPSAAGAGGAPNAAVGQ